VYSEKLKAVVIEGSESAERLCHAACEESLELFLNRQRVASILATPEMLEELALGYLVCEGAVEDPSEILNIKIEGGGIFVETRPSRDLELWFELRSSGCVGARWAEEEEVVVTSKTVFSPRVIWESLEFLESEVYQRTRGIHAACLVTPEGECAVKAVDVGRHNALDKVVGRALKLGLKLENFFLLSSGRQSAGMVLKAARAGIPLVATKTAPLNSGVHAARKCNLTLACYASPGGRLVIFSHPWRVQI